MSESPKKQRLLIFIVAYNAEESVARVLSRIPFAIFSDTRYETEILIIDDGSRDNTFGRGLDFQKNFCACPLTILKNPVNLGYGGNQKVGYRYALDQNFDLVALLHGDGQYAPEELPRLLEPLLMQDRCVDAVFGSRMLHGFAALAGGMPKHKFIGNKVLTFLQNRLTGMELSEWHSGYRLYSTSLLKKIPFDLNSNGFDFDTDIILQIKATKGVIAELPIPTFYGNEISHVNVVQYGLKILWTCLLFRIQALSLLYDPKFDLAGENSQYREKFSFESSHSLALDQINKDDSCLIVGCGPIEIVKPFINKSGEVALIDLHLNEELLGSGLRAWQADLDKIELGQLTGDSEFSKVLALDVIEHLKSPENFCAQIRSSKSCQRAEIIFTTPNVAFLPVRLMLLLGFFNYGKRGILDRTHTRLFTLSSLRRLLEQSGYEIIEMKGIPAPFPLALGDGWPARTLLAINRFFCRILPGLFSFQIFVRARILPTVGFLLREAKRHAEVEKDRLGGRS